MLNAQDIKIIKEQNKFQIGFLQRAIENPRWENIKEWHEGRLFAAIELKEKIDLFETINERLQIGLVA